MNVFRNRFFLSFSDKIPVEMMGKNPLDMSQYKKIFGTCRIPWEKRDKLSYNNSKHVTVIHNNHVSYYLIVKICELCFIKGKACVLSLKTGI